MGKTDLLHMFSYCQNDGEGGPQWYYDAWLPSLSLQVRLSAGSPSGLALSLYKCAAVWRAVYGPSATERRCK